MMVGLDVGRKRIGVAKTDELGLLAHGVGFIERKSDPSARDQIRALVLEWNARKVVIGLPKEMSGKIGQAAEEVMAFAELLKKDLGDVAVDFWDERLSTRETERTLISLDVSRSKRRKLLDQMSAQTILQSYLDSSKRRA